MPSDKTPIFDIHCHPSIKLYLSPEKGFDRYTNPPADISPLGLHVDLEGMSMSNTRVIANYHYILEHGFESENSTGAYITFLRNLGIDVTNKIERADTPDSAWARWMASYHALENKVVAARDRFPNVVIPRNINEFNDAFKNGKTIVLHAIEGAHHLGRGHSAEDYRTRLSLMRDAYGICIMTLAHFFPNDLCDTAGGIAPSTSKLIGYKIPTVPVAGLTPVGKATVEHALRTGVVIDLVHSSEQTREQVYQIATTVNAERKAEGLSVRPLIFSHTGVRGLFKNGPDAPQQDLPYVPGDNDIKQIQNCNGVLGIIMMKYWLKGTEEKGLNYDPGLADVLETIDYIHGITQTYDNISIGTDFDGFTEVPDDLKDTSKLGILAEAIGKKFGRKAKESICYKNAVRVLNDGWCR